MMNGIERKFNPGNAIDRLSEQMDEAQLLKLREVRVDSLDELGTKDIGTMSEGSMAFAEDGCVLNDDGLVMTGAEKYIVQTAQGSSAQAREGSIGMQTLPNTPDPTWLLRYREVLDAIEFPNGDFETDLSGWTWVSGYAWTWENGRAKRSGASFANMGLWSSAGISVIEGEIYKITVDVEITEAGGSSFAGKAYLYLTESIGTILSITNLTSWPQNKFTVSLVARVPTGTTTIYPKLRFYKSAGSCDFIWVDNFSIERVASDNFLGFEPRDGKLITAGTDGETFGVPIAKGKLANVSQSITLTQGADGSGNLAARVYAYKIVLTDQYGATLPIAERSITVGGTNRSVTIYLPGYAWPELAQFTGADIYRNAETLGTVFYKVASIAIPLLTKQPPVGNSQLLTGLYTDTAADATIIGNSTDVPEINTTFNRPALPIAATLWGDELFSAPDLSRVMNASQAYGYYVRQNTGVTAAVGDSLSGSVYLAAGTYKLKLLGVRTTGTGIVTVYVDGVAVMTYDFYNGSAVYNQTGTSDEFTVEDGLHYVSIVVTSKNASSAGYIYMITKLWFALDN